MAKVLKTFRERNEDFKKYNVGDEYPEKDKKRVEYLVEKGFLEAPKPKRKKGTDNNGDSDA